MGFEDEVFKRFLKAILSRENAEVFTETDVPSSNLRIDFLILKEASTLLRGFFPSFKGKEVIIGEFKSFLDRLRSYTLSSLLAKAMLVFDTVLRGKEFMLMSSNDDASSLDKHYENHSTKKNTVHKGDKETSERNPTKKPIYKRRLPSSLDSYAALLILGGNHRLERIASHYSFNDLSPFKVSDVVYQLVRGGGILMDFYVVVLRELPVTKETRLLKLFSTKEDRNRVIREAILTGDGFIYTLCLYLFREEVIKLTEVLEKKIDPLKESIREATEILGIEKVVDAVGIKKVVDAVGAEKVIEAVGIEKVINTLGIERVIETVGIEKVIKSLKKASLKKLDIRERKKIIDDLEDLLNELKEE